MSSIGLQYFGIVLNFFAEKSPCCDLVEMAFERRMFVGGYNVHLALTQSREQRNQTLNRACVKSRSFLQRTFVARMPFPLNRNKATFLRKSSKQSQSTAIQ